jgi:hypothetical protein
MLKIKKIIDLYNKVQKIPYYCFKERDPDLLLEKNRGSCVEKNLFLGKEFKKLGISVKYVLIKFNWNDLPIPEKIIKKLQTGGFRNFFSTWHLALKIKIDRKWVFVDATWDPELEKAGFPVVMNWDGKSDTKLAVIPKKIIELMIKPPKIFIKKLGSEEFFEALNKWLELQRKI